MNQPVEIDVQDIDHLYEKGLTHVFMEIALAAVKRFGVSPQRAHLDSSSFCVQGEYLNSEPEAHSAEIGPGKLPSRKSMWLMPLFTMKKT